MSQIHEGLEYKEFKMPSGIITAEVCKKSGMPAQDGVCNHDPRGSMVTTEYFAEGTVPEDVCVHHASVRICGVSGMLAGPYCPGTSNASSVRIIGGSPDSEDGPYLYTGNLNTCTVHTSESIVQQDPSEGDTTADDDINADAGEDPDADPGTNPGGQPGENPDNSQGEQPGTDHPEEEPGTVVDIPSEDEPVPNEVILDF